MSQLDWDRELKRIEREFDGGSPDPVIRLENTRKTSHRHGRGRAWAVWLRLFLVAGLAVGMYFWPYPRTCGVGLFSFMGAATLVGAGSLWVAASSWQARLVKPHAVSMLMLVVALGLLASQIMPRVGYAKVDAARPPSWLCGEGDQGAGTMIRRQRKNTTSATLVG